MKPHRAFSIPLSALALPTLCAAQASISYDTTWAGPVQLANSTLSSNDSISPAGFNIAEGTLIIPTLSLPAHPHEQVDQYAASFWVGLDGFLPASGAAVRGLWQAGLIATLSVNGTAAYTGFYEWVPDDPVAVPTAQLALSAGDYLHVCLNTSDGGLRGSVALTNLNTSQTFSYSQDAPVTWRGPTWPAPGTSAEWIVEAGTFSNGTRYVWPDWGNASFVGARACWNTSGECIVPGQEGGEERMTAVFWNDTGMVYSRSGGSGGNVWLAYLEEEFTG